MTVATLTITHPCEIDPDAFHSPLGERIGSDEYLRRINRARELCIECPIMLACRDRGRDLRERGIWGGETDEERAVAGYPPGPGLPDQPRCGTEAGARWHRRREKRAPCRRCRIAEREARLKRDAGKAHGLAA